MRASCPTMLVVLLAGLLAAGGCASRDFEDPNGIVFGKSIEGVGLGMSHQQVARLLMDPNILDYENPTGQWLRGYMSGPHAGLTLTFDVEAPAFERYTVTQVEVNDLYAGTSAQGIRIVSSREEVRASLGPPQMAYDDLDIYLFEEVAVHVRYRPPAMNVRSITFVRHVEEGRR